MRIFIYNLLTKEVGSFFIFLKRYILYYGTCLFLLFIFMTPPVVNATTNNLWFTVGEKFIYKLYWGIIPVGRAEITTKWIEEDKGKQFLNIRAIAKTSSIVAKIYPVNDLIESIVEPQSFLPIQYIQQLAEGRHFREDKTVFNHKEGKAFWASKLTGKNNDINIDSNTRDVLSLVYYMRKNGFKKGQKAKFKVLVDEKLYDLEVTGLKYEKIKLRGFGKIKCLKVEPKAKFGAIFARKGKVKLWFSDDKRHICMKMKAKMSIVGVKAILIGIEGIKE